MNPHTLFALAQDRQRELLAAAAPRPTAPLVPLAPFGALLARLRLARVRAPVAPVGGPDAACATC